MADGTSNRRGATPLLILAGAVVVVAVIAGVITNITSKSLHAGQGRQPETAVTSATPLAFHAQQVLDALHAQGVRTLDEHAEDPSSVVGNEAVRQYEVEELRYTIDIDGNPSENGVDSFIIATHSRQEAAKVAAQRKPFVDQTNRTSDFGVIWRQWLDSNIYLETEGPTPANVLAQVDTAMKQFAS